MATPDTEPPSAPGALRFVEVSVCAPDGTTMVDHVDLTLALDGVTVVVGPSGAGKSTLLRLCNRLEVPTSGRVLLDDVDLGDLDPLALRRTLGMVFQRPAVFAGTVADNLHVARMGANDEQLRAVLDEVGLDDIPLDRNGADLSGGEAQRMCLARTLLTDARVLLADEPTSALDPRARVEVEDVVRRLADDGLAVLWVTHDLPQARRLGDRIVAMRDGRVLDDGQTTAYLAELDQLSHDPDDPAHHEGGPP